MASRLQLKHAVIGVASLALIIPIVLSTGCGGGKGKFVTNLYRYYPESTAYFVEINTTESNSKRILNTIDKIGQKVSSSSVKAPQKLAEEFPKYFENTLSMGLWMGDAKPAKTKEALSKTPDAAHMVIALPVKSGVTFEQIQTGLDMQKPVTSTVVTPKSKTTAYSISSAAGEKPSSVMAIVNNTLLIAEDEATLQSAIEQSEGDKNVSTQEAVQKNIGNLDANRQGTIVSIQQPAMLEAMTTNAAADSKNLMIFLKQVQEVAPVSVGSIKIDDAKQLIDVATFTPLDFSKVKNEKLRKDMEALMSKNQGYSLPATVSEGSIASVGIYGLSQYYDIYMNYFASEGDKKTIQQANDQLKMMNLDLRKNIVALFDETTAISITSLAGGKTDVALLLNGTEETHRAIDQFTTMLSQMAQGHLGDQDFNGKKMKTLEAPMMPFKLAFGEIQPKVMAIGTLPSVQVLPSLSKGGSLESNSLYKDLSQGLSSSYYSFAFVNIDTLASQVPDMAQLKALGLKGALATNTAGKDMFLGTFRLKWDSASPETK